MTPPQVAGTRVRVRRGGASWQVRVDRLQDLRALAVMSVDTGLLIDVDVVVARWAPPAEGWIGRPRMPGVTALSVEPEGSGVRVRITLAEPRDAATVLAGCVRCLMPVPHDIGPQLTFGPGLPAAAAVLAPALHDVLTDGIPRDAHVRRADVLVIPAAADGQASDVERSTTLEIGASEWSREGQRFDVCVDPYVQRPMGRRSVGSTGVAMGGVTGGVLTLTGPEGRMVLGRAITASGARALRSIGAVVARDLPVDLVRQLHACGVLVLDSADEAPTTELDWQVRSVRERRHALRAFGPTAALDAWPTVSVLLVTHRPDFLEHAMQQVRQLAYPRLEVVVGVHGDAVNPAVVRAHAASLPHPSTVVAIDGQRTLGEALQHCSQRAAGDLLTKMDDDDLYGPEHIWDLVLARQYSGAQIVGKTLDWVHVVSEDVTVFRPTYPAEKYARFVAGGTILISRGDLAEVGGWRPVPKSVDRALLDRVLDAGGLVYRTHGLGYVYVRRPSGHTASVRDEHFLTKVTQTHPGLLRHPEFGTDA